MLAVDPLSVYIADLIVNKENNAEAQDSTVYGTLTRTRAECSLPVNTDDENGFPEEAYSATAAFMRHLMDRLNKEAVLVVTKTLLSVNSLDAAPSEEQINKLKETGAMGAMAMVHIVHVLRAALELVDWDYVAERVIEAGRKRAASESSEGG